VSSRDRLSNFLDKRGRTVVILDRGAGNITEKYAIARMNPNVKGAVAMSLDSYTEQLFRWDSGIQSGDVFQDGLSEQRHIVLSVQKIGIDGQHDGIRVSSCGCNDRMYLYQITKAASTPDGEYGHYNYNLLVKGQDYCHVSHWARGDSQTPIGDMTRGDVFVIFSSRILSGGYIPQPGDRIVLGNNSGAKLQIDGIDDHVFPTCYRVLCSPDQRM